MTKGREETISKKIESVETLFWKETDCGHYSGEGAIVVKGKRQTIAIGLESERG